MQPFSSLLDRFARRVPLVPSTAEGSRNGSVSQQALEHVGVHLPAGGGAPQMFLSQQLVELLGIDANRAAPFDAAPELPAEQPRPARMARAASETLLQQYMALWHSAPMVRSRHRDAAVRSWGNAVLEQMRTDGSDPAVVRRLERAFAAMQDAADLLERRLHQARQSLLQPSVLARLAARGVAVAEVRAGLLRHVDGVVHRLQALALEGMVVFPLVPSADALVEGVLHDWPTAGRGSPAAAQAGTAGTQTGPAAAFGEDPERPAGNTVGATPATSTRQTLLDTLEMPPILDRQQALRMLADFEAQASLVLPQLNTTSEAAAQLSQGVVEFREPMHMAVSMLCANRFPMQEWQHMLPSPIAGIPQTMMQATYPGSGRPFSQVQAVYVGSREAIVSRDGSHGVRVSLDRRHWIPTQIYTDDEVEAAKKAMWNRIFQRAFVRSIEVVRDAQNA